jgi:hypothetical protein
VTVNFHGRLHGHDRTAATTYFNDTSSVFCILEAGRRVASE